MMLGLNTAITGNGGIAPLLDYALEFNGTDEYLQIALPNNIASGTVNDWVSAGSKPAGWSETGTIVWNVTSEVGTTSTYSVSLFRSGGPSTEITIPGLTAGKKYKLRLRYKGTSCYISYGSSPTTFLSSSEWNAITIIFTAVGTNFYIGSSSGTCYVDYLSIKEDQDFDLNKDQEQILHSKNWDFERTLGTELASSTVTIGSKYVVTAGTVEGNAVGTEFLAITNATTLDANNKVREIPNLVSEGTFDSDTGYWTDTNVSIADGVCHFVDATNVGSNIFRSNMFTVGKKYRVSYEVKNYTSGGIAVRLGTYGTTRSANGVYTEDIVATQIYLSFYSLGAPLTTLDIDNVHIYEIPEWTATGNHIQNLSIIDDSGTGTHSMLVTASGAGDNTTNYVSLPSANIESVVSGKKYTLQGEARLDASSLVYGANILTNGDFETGVNTDNLTVESNCTLNFNDTETGKTGSYCLKMTNIASGYGWFKTLTLNKVYKISLRYKSPSATIIVRSSLATLTTLPISADWSSVTFYTYLTGDYLRFWLNGITSAFFDDIVILQADMVTLTAQLGTKSVTSSALSIVAGTFTKFVLNFEATASEQSQDLKLYLSGAGSVFVDKLSLTQRYDMVTIKKFKASDIMSGKYLLTMNRFYDFLLSSKQYIQIGGDGESIITNANINLNTTAWWNIVTKITHDALLVFDGTNTSTTTVATSSGKQTSAKLVIGSVGTSAFFAGQISHIQIWRFENISQSTFNFAITGLQYPTGGGSEEVLRLTFQSGVNITNCLKDYSPKAHTVSGVNVDITNRKRVTA